ncbi:MAG: ABC transporter ATP-binding protein [Chitinophagaceae bacterium]|nr:ABC transporter ATP-binding protein [Chitinophagaceae bacterium]
MLQKLRQELIANFENKDYELAFRRLLDFAKDSDDISFIKSAISISEKYEINATNDAELLNLINASHSLIEEIYSFQTGFKVNSETLVLETNDITKTYSHGSFSMKPISIKIKTGEIIGIVGENGNGKTTLLKCLCGQNSIDSGKIIYHLFTDQSNYFIKHKVAFIPQRIPRWYGNLKDNLHFNAAISGWEGKENEIQVDYMLERFKLKKYANLTWEQISSGYRTRFEIARILLQKPTLLILDEPLANLDIKAQETILTDLRFMSKSYKNPMAIILSSQQLHEVEKIADRVLVIRNGECVFNSAEEVDIQTSVLELETTMTRDELISILKHHHIDVQFNGGFFTLKSNEKSIQEIQQLLIENKVPINYCRNISSSSKRYF